MESASVEKNKNNIFGVELENYQTEDIYHHIDQTLNHPAEKLFIVTLNPEILLKARKDINYRKILNSADLKIIDGFGIKLVSFFKGWRTGERIAGVDLAEKILQRSINHKLNTLLIVNKIGLSQRKDFEISNFKFQISNCNLVEVDETEIPNVEISKDTEVLLVGLGAPLQEEFIYAMKDKLPNLKIAIGVGGTFDFWTGKQKRAPRFLRKMGLEWLWRILVQPENRWQRLKRAYQATVVFLYKAWFAS